MYHLVLLQDVAFCSHTVLHISSNVGLNGDYVPKQCQEIFYLCRSALYCVWQGYFECYLDCFEAAEVRDKQKFDVYPSVLGVLRK